MPILALQFEGKIKGPDGALVPIPPSVVLQQRGPTVQVTISPSDKVVAQLVRKNFPVPQPITGDALIDTGASMTCIDEEAAINLNLPVVNVIQMASASHASHPANVYPAKIAVIGFPLQFNMPMVIGAALKPQKLIALIGRDILSGCQLVYSGGMGQITLSV